jgi:hypothetical protein
MCGKVTNVKLRLIKEVDGFTVGQVYEPYWWREHDMNRSPVPRVVYLKNDRGNETFTEITNFENATP